MIIGRLGGDPEIRTTQSGDTVATLSVATSSVWTDKSGQKQEQTEWHKIIFWKRQAEVCRDYLKKGSQVYVEGKITTRKWTDQQGYERYTTEIKGEVLQMLGGKTEQSQNSGPKTSYAQASGGTTKKPPPTKRDTQPDYPVQNDLDDDIPF